MRATASLLEYFVVFYLLLLKSGIVEGSFDKNHSNYHKTDPISNFSITSAKNDFASALNKSLNTPFGCYRIYADRKDNILHMESFDGRQWQDVSFFDAKEVYDYYYERLSSSDSICEESIFKKQQSENTDGNADKSVISLKKEERSRNIDGSKKQLTMTEIVRNIIRLHEIYQNSLNNF